MLPPIEREWQAALERLEHQHMGRTLVGQTGRTDFLSNDVLGLSQTKAVREAAAQAALEFGVGSRASRLLGGDHPLLIDAENAAAKWIGTESALLFPSGFQANLGVLTSLPKRGDVLLSDQLNHASIIDGSRLSAAQVAVYAHADPNSLERQLKAHRTAKKRWVVTESLFSMDGDEAPLLKIAELCRTYKAQLIVDEAHAAGLLGPEGRGLCAQYPNMGDVLTARIVTGGKALGVSGAFVLGSTMLRNWLIHNARSFIYTTGMSLPIAAALKAAIELVPSMETERQQARSGAKHLARILNLPQPSGSIVPIPCGTAEVALSLASELRSEGLHLHAVRPPTVPPGGSRLRVVVHAEHKQKDLELLAETVREAKVVAPTQTATGPTPTTPWVVLGTDTDVGKTVASALLLHAACQFGSASYWKPIQSGMPSDTDTVRDLTASLPVEMHPAGIEFSLPKSPDQAARAEGRFVHPAQIQRLFAKYSQASADTLIVETAGGLCVPWNDHFQTIDWISELRPNLILVARSGLGTLNHTQLTLRALRSVGLEPKALVLTGPPHTENKNRLMMEVDCPVIELPWLAELNSDTLADVAQSHSFDWLNQTL